MSHNLPPFDQTSFIGRENEKKSILQKISLDCQDKIITVSGITGVGKSSLVLWAAYDKYSKEFDKIVYPSAKRRNLSVDQGIIPVDNEPLKTSGQTHQIMLLLQ
jgi:excinuclease UvrABC ATPase subunit